MGMLCFQTDLNIINIIINDKKLLLHSITLTAKCSKKMKGDKSMKNVIN